MNTVLPKVIWLCPNGYDGYFFLGRSYEATGISTRLKRLCPEPMSRCRKANQCLTERYEIAKAKKKPPQKEK